MNLPIQTRHWLTFLIFALISILLYAIDDHVHDALRFQSNAIYQGELWRLLTGHFIHTNYDHLLLNVGGLLLLWALHGEYYDAKTTAMLATLCGLLTSLGLLFFSDTTHYVGLSSIIHGVFAWGAIQDVRLGMKSGWILIVGIFVKIGYEQIYGGSEEIAQMINANVAVDSHLWGILSGALLAVFFRIKKDA